MLENVFCNIFRKKWKMVLHNFDLCAILKTEKTYKNTCFSLKKQIFVKAHKT